MPFWSLLGILCRFNVYFPQHISPKIASFLAMTYPISVDVTARTEAVCSFLIHPARLCFNFLSRSPPPPIILTRMPNGLKIASYLAMTYPLLADVTTRLAPVRRGGKRSAPIHFSGNRSDLPKLT